MTYGYDNVIKEIDIRCNTEICLDVPIGKHTFVLRLKSDRETRNRLIVYKFAREDLKNTQWAVNGIYSIYLGKSGQCWGYEQTIPTMITDVTDY
jgi:hypothetical protein